MRRMPVLVPHTLCVALVTAFVAAAASGQAQKESPFTADADRSPGGESWTSGHDLASMLRSLDTDLTPSRQDQQRHYPGVLTLDPIGRGVAAMYFDDFSSYPQSTDPIFARFAVNMQDQSNPQGGFWDFAQAWYIPTLFVAGQFDGADPPSPDPLPRWQGADLVENAGLGNLFADINGDGVVDTADLGILLGSFGAMGVNSADINLDGVVDTADLGIMLGEFGQTSGPFCVYLVDQAHTIDTDGIPLDPTTIAAGPIVAQIIAIPNGSYSNDVDADGCPDCDFFRIDPDGGMAGELVYGTWSLIDPAQVDLLGVDFAADVAADTCSGWGSEDCMCDSRAETNVIENACCFLGAVVDVPSYTAEVGVPIIAEVDVFLSNINTFQWLDWSSTEEGLNTGRVFLGGYAASLGAEFLSFADVQGRMDRFVIFGINEAGENEYFATIEQPLFGAAGIRIKTGEWFTLRLVVKIDEIQFWLSDSETRALIDPNPGDDGDSTPLDGSDDIEDGFAKIFPTGPFGPAIGSGFTPNLPAIPQPILGAVSIDTVRFLWAGDPTNAEIPGFEPFNVCYDNIMITGSPTP